MYASNSLAPSGLAGPAPAAPVQRDLAFDALKGFLVLGMVLYHSLNYFPVEDAGVLGYLRFVNGSFVFLVGLALALRWSPEAGRATTRRAVWRGLRLLLVFAALNLLIALMGMTNYRNAAFGIEPFLRNLVPMFIVGEGVPVAFRVLAPIAYVLMLAPLCLAAPPGLRASIAAATLLAAGALGWVAGPVAATPSFVLVGLCGVWAGMASSFWARPLGPVWALVLLTAVLVAAMDWLSGNTLAYALGLWLMLKCVYDLARAVPLDGAAARAVRLLGQYSLVAYIAQIVLLHVLHRARSVAAVDGWTRIALVCVVTTSCLLALCHLLGWARSRASTFDRAYRAVFA